MLVVSLKTNTTKARLFNNKLIKKLKLDEVYYEMKFMDVYDKFPKWLMFWTITFFFVLSLWTFNKGLYYSNITDNIKNLEYFKLNGVLFAVYGTIITIYLNLTNTIESTRLYHEKVDYEKKKNSWQLIEKWDSSTIMEARDFTREIKNKANQLSPNDLIKEIEESDKDVNNKHKNLKRSLISCYNFFETLKITMDKGLADKEMLKDSFKDIFIDMYDRFKPYTSKHKMTHCNNIIDKLYDEWK